MKKKFFIGIDVSKHSLDAAFVVQQGANRSEPCWQLFDNTAAGLANLKGWMISDRIPLDSNTLIVIENTGLYHRQLMAFCCKHQLQLCIENGAQVKWSLGIARGKSDKVDSRRLAIYAYRFADRLKATPVLHAGIQAIKDLISLRSRQLVQVKSLQANLKELANTTAGAAVRELEKIHAPLIKAANTAIKKMEAAIATKINESTDTKQQYKLLLSIPGIGPITAAYLIASTNGFTNCNSGKQLACYCGVVPFDHQSGISIRGKSKVHKMANKTLKSLLHMCALVAIKYSKEFKGYVERKKTEGKHMMSIINAVRNKLVLRAYSVVTNGKPYEECMILAA